MSKKSKFSKQNLSILVKTSVQSVSFSFKHLPIFTILALFFVIASYLFDYVRSFIDSKIIDSLIHAVAIKQIDSTLLNWFFALLFIYLITSIINQLDRASAVVYFGRFDNLINTLLAKKLSSLDIAVFESPEGNKLIQKVTQNSYRLRAYLYSILDLIGITLSLTVASVIVFKVNPYIFILLVLCYIPYAFSEFKFGKSLWGIWDTKGETRMHAGHINWYLTNEKNIPEVRVFGIRDHLLNLYNNFYKVFLDEQFKVEKQKTLFRTFFDLIGTLAFGLAYFLILQQAVKGEISIGTTTFYVASVNKLWNNVYRFFGGLSKLFEDNLYAADFFKLMSMENKVKSGETIADISTPKIEFKDVWFKYPNSKKYIFKDFSFVLNKGDHVAMVGENGAGKSTFIKLLLRFYDVNKGQILINDVDIKHYDLTSLYKLFAVLSQSFVQYHFNVKTNIGLGNLEKLEDDNSIINSAKLSGADVFIKKYKDKYNQVLSKQFENGTEPSTGQWQKIALARAFFKNSPVLILDEPTSAIDPKAEYQIFEKLFDFAKDKTVLIISHRFSTVRNADRIIVLDGGKVVEEGSHKQLIDKNGIYKEAYDLQKKGYEDV